MSNIKKKKISYGRWESRNFKEDFYEFKRFIYRGDFTMAGIVLKDFRNGIESLRCVLAKMEREYKSKR